VNKSSCETIPASAKYNLPLLLLCHNERMGIDELQTDRGCWLSCGYLAVKAATTDHAHHREGEDAHSPTSTMWASRQSSACSQQEADSLTDHFARPTKGSSWTSSDLGLSRPTCYLKRSCTHCARVVAVVVVAKSWSDERRPPSLVGLESGWDSGIRRRRSATGAVA